MGVNNITPIKISSVKRGNDYLRGSNIGSYGDIVKVAHTQKLVISGAVAVRTSISEEQKHVHLVIGNARSDLPALRL